MSSKTAPTEFEKRASGTMDLILEELRGVKLELQKQGEKLEKQGEKIEEQGEAMRELREARPSSRSPKASAGSLLTLPRSQRLAGRRHEVQLQPAPDRSLRLRPVG
jgi:hypothetical protein